MVFYNMDFNFAHFAHFNFAHFKIEESFGLICVKLQSGWFDSQISISIIYFGCSFQVWPLFLFILCMKKVLGKFG